MMSMLRSTGSSEVREAVAATQLVGRHERKGLGGPPRLRRRGSLVAVATVVVVLASVAFDVGRGTDTVDRRGDFQIFVATLNTDVASCNSSLQDSLAAYLEVAGGRPDERAAAEAIVRGDEPNCTPVGNTNLYDMDTTETPASLRALGLQSVVTDLGSWSFPNAAAAIDDIGRLLTRTEITRATDDLRARTAAMDRSLDSAQGALDAAAGVLHTRVHRLNLGATSRLTASGF